MAARLLLHLCCGPCGTSTHAYWQEQGLLVTGFFFNPNIHPLLEYRRRLEGARDLAAHVGMPLVEDLTYNPEEWFAHVVDPHHRPENESRCAACIGLRLERAALAARENECEAFSTSLAISPWQDHEAIRSKGEAAGLHHGVEFLYQDLRSLYPESRRLSREWGLYRQKYCGCLLSEWERYRDS